MSNQVGNPKDRFSHNEAEIRTLSVHLKSLTVLKYFMPDCLKASEISSVVTTAETG